MNHLDPRTAIVLTGIMSGLMALVLYSLQRNYPPSIKGLREWSLALLLFFIAGALTAFRSRIPDAFSITMANLLLSLGMYLAYVGSQIFYGVKPRPVPWLALIFIVLLGQIWFTHFEPIYYTRLIQFNLLAACMFLVHAHLIFKEGLTSFARILTFGVMVYMVAIQIMRMVAIFIWPINDGLMDTSPHHLIYITSFAFSILLFSIGVVLLATDKLRTELEHLATHDSLTNALTRRHMNEIAHSELERCKRSGRSMALLLIDLDHFKKINDSYGHQAGDRVLINFVTRVRALLRLPDRLGRFGGEEFVVLLPEASLDEAIQAANRIRESCAAEAQGPTYTVSIGVSVNQGDADTVDAILARADAAMYRAKSNGRNRVEMG